MEKDGKGGKRREKEREETVRKRTEKEREGARRRKDRPTTVICVTLPQMTGAPVDLYPKTRGLWVSRHAEFDFDGPSTRRRRSMRRSEKTPHFGPRKRPSFGVRNEACSQNDAWNGVVGCWDRRNQTQRVEKTIILVSWSTGLPVYRSSGVA